MGSFAVNAFDPGDDVLAGAETLAGDEHDILGVDVDTSTFHNKKVWLIQNRRWRLTIVGYSDPYFLLPLNKTQIKKPSTIVHLSSFPSSTAQKPFYYLTITLVLL